MLWDYRKMFAWEDILIQADKVELQGMDLLQDIRMEEDIFMEGLVILRMEGWEDMFNELKDSWWAWRERWWNWRISVCQNRSDSPRNLVDVIDE